MSYQVPEFLTSGASDDWRDCAGSIECYIGDIENLTPSAVDDLKFNLNHIKKYVVAIDDFLRLNNL